MSKDLPGMSLENIVEACDGEYVGDRKKLKEYITGAVIDSRKVKEDYLFVAIQGERVDGHDFANQVLEEGALCVLSEKDLPDCKGPYIKVPSTKDAFRKIAAFYRAHIEAPIIGVTGSVGKTSTKEMIATVLSEKYEVQKTAGNFNNELGVPLTLFTIQPKHEVAVVEMGISDFGEMDRLSQMAVPDVMVITNIGTCHLEQLKDRDGVLKAKTECFGHMQPRGIAVLNGDDDKLITQKMVNGIPPIFYGKGFQAADGSFKEIYATDVENLGFEGMKAKINTPAGAFEIRTHIPGEHNIYNAMAATAIALRMGLTREEIARGIEKAKTIEGRTNFIEAKGMIVIDDCYNANPMSMKTSIQTLAHAKGRSIAVLGDMGELGENARALHREVGICVGEEKIDALFATGELAEEYAKAAAEQNPDCEIIYEKDKEAMIQKLLSYVKEGDSVLVKASHFMEFGEIVSRLTK
ncbi:MAG: UDP-N-acetylmuramoyl-tripeptide--D-alanyl-D-alanine ligase [Lachnospiraceae bacterium]|nr:UDP-N-acetylmuramoyl-tripeptide--D-alanyl-D-alanine ligase [Lachnospiraceae bacterium]